MRSTSSINNPSGPFYRKRLLAVLLIAGSFAVPYLASDYVLSGHGPVVCPLRAVTGIPCPSCGITRALACLTHGRFAEATAFHPLSIPLAAIFLLLALGLVGEMAAGRAWIRNPFSSHRSIMVLFYGVVAFQVIRTALFFRDGGWPIFLRENIFGRIVEAIRLLK